MANKIIYAVTSGDYSGYQIEGLFSTQKKAEEYINHSSNTELNGVDEWVLNELKPDKGEKVFKLRSKFDEIDFHITGYGPDAAHYKDLMCRADSDGWIPNNDVIFYICADTRGRAIKIASERLRQVKAEEHFRYPLLRRSIGVKSNDYKKQIYPFVHYHTGEVILPSYYSLIPGSIPKDLASHVKVITMEELVARYKKEETDDEQ